MGEIYYKIEPDVSDDELHELFNTAWPNYRPSSFRSVLNHSLTYICAFDAQQLVGFVNIAWDGRGHGFILDTTVHGGYQRKGIGTELLRWAARVATERGIDWLHVDYEPHLEDFYRGAGYRHTEAGLLNLKVE